MGNLTWADYIGMGSVVLTVLWLIYEYRWGALGLSSVKIIVRPNDDDYIPFG